MIIMNGKKLGLSLDRIWFWNGEKIESKAQIIRYLRIDPTLAERLPNPKSYDFNHTLLTDLTQNEEEIWALLNKNYRYEIRRAQKEGADFKVYSSYDLQENSTIIEEFEKAYNTFCDTIHNEAVRSNYSHNMILQFIEKNALVITKAEQQGAVVFHIYMLSEME